MSCFKDCMVNRHGLPREVRSGSGVGEPQGEKGCGFWQMGEEGEADKLGLHRGQIVQGSWVGRDPLGPGHNTRKARVRHMVCRNVEL